MRKNTGKTPMSELLQKLTRSCFADRDALDVARAQAALWQTWLLPVATDTPVGEDPGYHDDFLRIRDEMNKLSGADTDLICQLAESLLLTQAKDVRIATYYIWARLHRDGERGLAEGWRCWLDWWNASARNCCPRDRPAGKWRWSGWRGKDARQSCPLPGSGKRGFCEHCCCPQSTDGFLRRMARGATVSLPDAAD